MTPPNSPPSAQKGSEMAEKMTLREAIAVLNPEPKSYQAIKAWEVVRSHITQPAQAVDDGMLPDALVPHAKEWYRLCERRFHVDRMTISGKLAAAIVEAISTRALGNAQAEGWKVPEGLVLLPIDPTEKMVEAICRAHARTSVWPSGFDPTAQRIRRESATLGYRAVIAHASVGAE